MRSLQRSLTTQETFRHASVGHKFTRTSVSSPTIPRRKSVDVRSQAVQVAETTVAAANRRRLGDSDLLVSECCLGTMTWGEQNTEQEAHQQLSYAFDLGINFLDTAEMYPVPPKKETQGSTDRYIGQWMKGRKREDIILATKVSGYSKDRGYVRKAGFCRVTPDQIEESVDASLQRLQTDYIDLLQIHWPDRYVPLFGGGGYDPSLERESIPFEEQLRGMQKVVEAGKVRYIGVSNETSFGVMSFCQAAEKYDLPKIVSIQNAYSLLVRTAFETDLLETCGPKQMNVGLLPYSPLAGGGLSGKYLKGEPKGARFLLFPGYMERYNKSLAREATVEYAAIAEKYNLSLTQMALSWVNKQPGVTSTIIGATSMEQLQENIGAFGVELPKECLADIDAVYKRYRDPSQR